MSDLADETREYSPEERLQIQRFIKALNQAMIASRASQRELGEMMDVAVGTVTKYLRGSVPPLKVGLGIQANLAKALGVTLDALYAYYRCGQYISEVNIQSVEGWLRSEAGQETLPRLMAGMNAAAQRWAGMATLKEVEGELYAEEEEQGLPAWEWPIDEVESADLTERILDRLSLTRPRLEALAYEGVYDEELIEGFAVACNYQEQAVREAFEKRQAIT